MKTEMKIKKTHLWIFGGVIIIAMSIIIFLPSKGTVPVTEIPVVVSNTSGDKQTITVTVQGGYSPETISAKADIPVSLIMNSQGAYGCERSFTIPKLGIRKILPLSGQTQIDVPAQAKGTQLLGTCSMGMYSFVINFN